MRNDPHFQQQEMVGGRMDGRVHGGPGIVWPLSGNYQQCWQLWDNVYIRIKDQKGATKTNKIVELNVIPLTKRSLISFN